LSAPVTIAAVYEMRPGRYPDQGPFDLYRTMLRDAITQWGIRPDMIDGMMASPSGQAQGQTDAYVHVAGHEVLHIWDTGFCITQRRFSPD